MSRMKEFYAECVEAGLVSTDSDAEARWDADRVRLVGCVNLVAQALSVHDFLEALRHLSRLSGLTDAYMASLRVVRMSCNG